MVVVPVAVIGILQQQLIGFCALHSATEAAAPTKAAEGGGGREIGGGRGDRRRWGVPSPTEEAKQ